MHENTATKTAIETVDTACSWSYFAKTKKLDGPKMLTSLIALSSSCFKFILRALFFQLFLAKTAPPGPVTHIQDE